MTLQQQLDAFKAQFINNAPEEAKTIMNRATQDLFESGILENTPKVGDILPGFSLKNQDGETIQSDDLLQKGPLVISFFRGVWCPYCNIELKSLQSYADQFRTAGANIVVISPQEQPSAQKTITENGLSFDVLSDIGNSYAQQLGLTFTLPADLQTVYQGFNINLPDHNGDDSWMLPMPARLVIDASGKVLFTDINPDYTQRTDPAETLAVLTP